MDNMNEAVAVAMATVAVDEVQAAAEPVAVGTDTSSPEQAGWATSDKVGKQTQIRTSDHAHQT